MKMMCRSILLLGALLLVSPLLRAQDFPRYRGFSLGTTLAAVLNHTDQKPADVNVTHEGPPLLQELNWWPPSIPGNIFRPDTVEQILFSFYDGSLYKMSVTYEQSSTEGLTVEDMMKSISAKYGPATMVMAEADPRAVDGNDLRQKDVASWEDAQYSFTLVRATLTARFSLVICSKRLNTEAENAIAEAVKREKEESPLKLAELQKKDADDRETARQKNKKTFQP
jgi:hypothetical protein